MIASLVKLLILSLTELSTLFINIHCFSWDYNGSSFCGVMVSAVSLFISLLMLGATIRSCVLLSFFAEWKIVAGSFLLSYFFMGSYIAILAGNLLFDTSTLISTLKNDKYVIEIVLLTSVCAFLLSFYRHCNFEKNKLLKKGFVFCLQISMVIGIALNYLKHVTVGSNLYFWADFISTLFLCAVPLSIFAAIIADSLYLLYLYSLGLLRVLLLVFCIFVILVFSFYPILVSLLPAF